MIPIHMTDSRHSTQLFFSIVLSIWLSVSSYAQEYDLSPIGVVDMEVIFATFLEESNSIRSFVTLRAEYERAMRSERVDLDEVTLAMLAAKLDGDDRTVERKQQEIQDRKENYRALDDFWRRRIEVAREKLSGDGFYSRFEKAVEFVAIDNKFSIVAEKGNPASLFSAESALYSEQKSLFAYASDQVDVTDEVVARIRNSDN